MPVSVCEPVILALRESLNSNEDSQNLDRQLITSAKRVLRTHIEYEEVDSYKGSILESLKCKYVVLNSNSKHGLEKSMPSAAIGPGNDVLLPTPKRVLFSQDAVQLGWGPGRKWSVGTGMMNMGNTCYLNSTLQALFHVPSLANWLISDVQHRDRCEESGGGQGGCVICAVAKTLLASQSNSVPIKPWLVYSKLRLVCRHLVPGRQEDAHEFLRYLVEAMEKSYLSRYKNNKELDQYSKETTPLNQILGGYLRSAVRCLTCAHVSTTFQHFQDLLLDIRKASTLEEGLDGYFSRERLEDMGYRCESCKRKVSATKQFSLERPPSVLCIQLKRFSMLGNKINKHITFTSRLDLTRFVWNKPAEPLIYRLVAMVTHLGTSQHCGHYTAIGLAEGGIYYQFDDSSVRSIPISSVVSTNAYIMFYELERTPKKLWSPITNNKPLTVSDNNRPRTIPETCKSPASLTISLPKEPCETSQFILLESTKLAAVPCPSKPVSPSCSQSPRKLDAPPFIGPILQLPVKQNNSVSKLILPRKNDCTIINSDKFVTSGSKLVTFTSNKVQEKIVKTMFGASMPDLTDQTSPAVTKPTDPNIFINNNTTNILNGNSSIKENNSPIASIAKRHVENLKSDVIIRKPNGVITTNGQSSSGTVNTSLRRLVDYGSEDSNSDSESETSKPIAVNGTEEINTRATVQGWKVSKAITPDEHIPSLQGETGWTCSAKKKLKNGISDLGEEQILLPAQLPLTNGGSVNTHALVKLSHHGFTAQNWNGGRSQVEREVGDERREERKRTHDATDDMDRGRSKKIKSFSNHGRDNPNYNPFQEYQNNRRFNHSSNSRSYFNNHNRHNNGNQQRGHGGGGFRSRHHNRGSYHHSARPHHQRENHVTYRR